MKRCNVRLATIAYDAQSRRQSVRYANGSAALFDYSARGDIRCHDINLSGAAASACNGAGAEVAYDFTSNGVGQPDNAFGERVRGDLDAHRRHRISVFWYTQYALRAHS